MIMGPNYGCSLVAKLSQKENICVFYKIYIICRKKNLFIQNKNFMQKIKLLLRKTFFQKKTFCTENVSVTNKNIYRFESYNHFGKEKF